MTTVTDTFDLVPSINDCPLDTTQVVDVPALTVLAVDGVGSPGSDEFRQGVRDLWRVVYAVQQLPKHGWVPEGHRDYTVPPTEIQFLTNDRTGAWHVFLPQPSFVTADVVQHAFENLSSREMDLDNRVQLAQHPAQRAVQRIHVGHPREQATTIAALRADAEREGLTIIGTQHEIVIDDPQRVGFEQARNLLRYEVAR